MMMLSYSTANVHRRKQRKYIGLNRGYEQLNHVDKGYHDRRKNTNRVGFKDEYQRDEGDYYNVTRCDGYEQSDHQSKRLRTQPDKFNQYHDRQ